jgi:excisionase family DNA binding protein
MQEAPAEAGAVLQHHSPQRPASSWENAMQGKSSLLPADRAATITGATDDDCLTYTVVQAARLAGVSVSYYYRAAHQGLVPAKFLGRRIVVPKAALRRFLGDTEASSGGDEAA